MSANYNTNTTSTTTNTSGSNLGSHVAGADAAMGTRTGGGNFNATDFGSHAAGADTIHGTQTGAVHRDHNTTSSGILGSNTSYAAGADTIHGTQTGGVHRDHNTTSSGILGSNTSHAAGADTIHGTQSGGVHRDHNTTSSGILGSNTGGVHDHTNAPGQIGGVHYADARGHGTGAHHTSTGSRHGSNPLSGGETFTSGSNLGSHVAGADAATGTRTGGGFNATDFGSHAAGAAAVHGTHTGPGVHRDHNTTSSGILGSNTGGVHDHTNAPGHTGGVHHADARGHSTGAHHTSTDSHHASTTMRGGDSYPEQRHAGAVGLGPHLAKNTGHAGPSAGEKLAGLKDQLKGAITGNAELKQEGKERRTGELHRQENLASVKSREYQEEHEHDLVRASTTRGDHVGTHNVDTQKMFGVDT